MFRSLVAALLFLAAPAAAQDRPPPATVVVAFDKDAARPLIVEGLANKQTGRAVEANDPVRIASISKLVMTLAMLRLMDEGKVDPNRDVSDYLGWRLRSPYRPDEPITLYHLLMHRAGLSDRAGYIVPLGESLKAKLADPAAWRDPGTGQMPSFEYANLGSPLVATALEAASGERYDRLVERLVFVPLGIKACLNWLGCDAAMQARAVTLYRDTGEVARDDPSDMPPACPIPVIAGQACDLAGYVPGTNASIFSPQGGVRIGMMDLAKIGQVLLRIDGKPGFLSVTAQTVWFQTMITALHHLPQDDSGFCGYGLGTYALADQPPCRDDLFRDGGRRVGHGGEAYGLRSGLWMSFDDETGIAYFTTEVPPPTGEVETAASDPREIALMARARALMAQ
jgi:CubicO group peptidase (beta-lactamase class C family)